MGKLFGRLENPFPLGDQHEAGKRSRHSLSLVENECARERKRRQWPSFWRHTVCSVCDRAAFLVQFQATPINWKSCCDRVWPSTQLNRIFRSKHEIYLASRFPGQNIFWRIWSKSSSDERGQKTAMHLSSVNFNLTKTRHTHLAGSWCKLDVSWHVKLTSKSKCFKSHLRPRGKWRKLAWQGALRENTQYARNSSVLRDIMSKTRLSMSWYRMNGTHWRGINVTYEENTNISRAWT